MILYKCSLKAIFLMVEFDKHFKLKWLNKWDKRDNSLFPLYVVNKAIKESSVKSSWLNKSLKIKGSNNL